MYRRILLIIAGFLLAGLNITTVSYAGTDFTLIILKGIRRGGKLLDIDENTSPEAPQSFDIPFQCIYLEKIRPTELLSDCGEYLAERIKENLGTDGTVWFEEQGDLEVEQKPEWTKKIYRFHSDANAVGVFWLLDGVNFFRIFDPPEKYGDEPPSPDMATIAAAEYMLLPLSSRIIHTRGWLNIQIKVVLRDELALILLCNKDGNVQEAIRVTQSPRGLVLRPRSVEGNVDDLVKSFEQSCSISPLMRGQRRYCRESAVVDLELFKRTVIAKMKKIEGFKTLKEIGQGSYSFVVSGYLPGERQMVACKTSLGGSENDQSVIREALLLQHLSHPNLVRLLGADISSTFTPRIFLTFATGKSLEAILKETSLDEAKIWKVISKTAAALGYLHGQDIVHLDIKPGNIMVLYLSEIAAEEAIVTVIDLGLARSIEEKRKLRASAGTPKYMPPEGLRGEVFDGRMFDVWGMGSTTYEAVIGGTMYEDAPDKRNVRNMGKRMKRMELYTQDALGKLNQKSGLQGFIGKTCKFEPDERSSIRDLQATDPWLRGKFLNSNEPACLLTRQQQGKLEINIPF
ncbi:protein kinase [Sansalvadorimonas sp. 2012CJ34-2]|uniref:Protein kinase n=1 Tax=Parendozoicomonas callyspongiae TaxID=2942213 RepID=A0ABT0PJ49_9GAMM|nr:protein kinase [Sansalvadorimonas sp. 2012CJ34-2]MCL6271405.1 protein kinase [Sansalvadorimonas sp. 2012CJ34-2]